MLLKSDEPTLVLTNLKKVFWPDEGYTKRDQLDCYREIAPVILPEKEGIIPVFRVRLSQIAHHARGTKGCVATFETMAPAISLPSW
jgi:DNA primase